MSPLQLPNMGLPFCEDYYDIAEIFTSPVFCGLGYNYWNNPYQHHPHSFSWSDYDEPIEEFKLYPCPPPPYFYDQQSQDIILGSDGSPSMRMKVNDDGSVSYTNLRRPSPPVGLQDVQGEDGWITYTNPNPRPKAAHAAGSHLDAVEDSSKRSDAETDSSKLSSGHPTFSDEEEIQHIGGSRDGDTRPNPLNVRAFIQKTLSSVSEKRWERIASLLGPRRPDDYLPVRKRCKRKRSFSEAEETGDETKGAPRFTPFGWVLYPKAPTGRAHAAPTLTVTDPSGQTFHLDDPVKYGDAGSNAGAIPSWDTIVADLRQKCPGGNFAPRKSKKRHGKQPSARNPKMLPCVCFERRESEWKRKQGRGLSSAEGDELEDEGDVTMG